MGRRALTTAQLSSIKRVSAVRRDDFAWWAIALLIVLAAMLLPTTCGCSNPQQRVLNSVEVGEWVLPYNHALDACRIEAKKQPEGQQFKFYDKCEQEETHKICERNPRFRAAWRQCLEVMP